MDYFGAAQEDGAAVLGAVGEEGAAGAEADGATADGAGADGLEAGAGADGAGAGAEPGGRGRMFMFWNLEQAVGAPVLTVLVAGAAAEARPPTPPLLQTFTTPLTHP